MNVRWICVVTAVVIAMCVFAGCASKDNAAAPTTAPATKTVAPTPIPAPTPSRNMFTAGDIIVNPDGTPGIGWLVIGYDLATDSYVREAIHQNSGGSWGYRLDDKSVTSPRETTEKIYRVRVGNVASDGITIDTITSGNAPVKETIPAITQPTASPSNISETLYPTPVVAVQEDTNPVIVFIEPAFTFMGPSQEITITGANFNPGSGVVLKSTSGKPDINPRITIFDSDNKLRVLFDTPVGSAGVYDFIVFNPDGKQSVKKSGFSIS